MLGAISDSYPLHWSLFWLCLPELGTESWVVSSVYCLWSVLRKCLWLDLGSVNWVRILWAHSARRHRYIRALFRIAMRDVWLNTSAIPIYIYCTLLLYTSSWAHYIARSCAAPARVAGTPRPPCQASIKKKSCPLPPLFQQSCMGKTPTRAGTLGLCGHTSLKRRILAEYWAYFSQINRAQAILTIRACACRLEMHCKCELGTLKYMMLNKLQAVTTKCLLLLEQQFAD